MRRDVKIPVDIFQRVTECTVQCLNWRVAAVVAAASDRISFFSWSAKAMIKRPLVFALLFAVFMECGGRVFAAAVASCFNQIENIEWSKEQGTKEKRRRKNNVGVERRSRTDVIYICRTVVGWSGQGSSKKHQGRRERPGTWVVIKYKRWRCGSGSGSGGRTNGADRVPNVRSDKCYYDRSSTPKRFVCCKASCMGAALSMVYCFQSITLEWPSDRKCVCRLRQPNVRVSIRMKEWEVTEQMDQYIMIPVMMMTISNKNIKW